MVALSMKVQFFLNVNGWTVWTVSLGSMRLAVLFETSLAGVLKQSLSASTLWMGATLLQVECEGFAPIQRKAGVISVDVGQGILTYDLAEGTMRLEGPDCGTLLVRGSKVVHAPACLSAPTASALAAMEETRRCWDLHQAMVQKHADWEQAQRDYITAMAAHEVLEGGYPLEADGQGGRRIGVCVTGSGSGVGASSIIKRGSESTNGTLFAKEVESGLVLLLSIAAIVFTGEGGLLFATSFKRLLTNYLRSLVGRRC